MKKLRFLHCADIHLDAPFASLGSEAGKSAERRRDLRQTFRRIMNIAVLEKVDIILICGDLYEDGYIRKETVNFFNDSFGSVPDIRIFIIPGNHDPYYSGCCYKNFKWSKNVFILTDDKPYAELEELGVCVYGVGNIRSINSDFINILMAHGTVDMDVGRNIYNPMTSEYIDTLNMDYVALGHFHNRIEGAGKKRNIYNPGSPEPLGFDEPGEHGVFLGTVTKTGRIETALELSFVKLNCKFYENIDVDMKGSSTNEQVIERVAAGLRDRDGKNGLFDLRLKGYIDKDLKINTSLISSFFKDKVFFIKIKDETTIDYDFDEISKEPGLRGLFVRKVFSLMDKAGDEHEKSRLMKALYYGLEALERGEVEVG